MSSRFVARARGAEHLDAPVLDDEILAASLRQIAGVNRWLGGARALLRHLAPTLDAHPSVSIVDVGTGAADIPLLIARRASRRGHRVTIVALDSHEQVARCAQTACAESREVAVVVAVGQHLPLGSNAVDVAVSSMTLHHLSDLAAVGVVREMARVARRAVILNDLERHPLNYVGARLLALTAWRGNPYTRDDGPLSVLRGFRAHELLSIGRRAGLEAARVHRVFPYRLVLVGRPAGAGE